MSSRPGKPRPIRGPRAASIDVTGKHSILKTFAGKEPIKRYSKKRSLSMEKTRPMHGISPQHGHRVRHSNHKLDSGHPGPKECTRLQQEHGLVQQVQEHLRLKRYDHALPVLRQLLSEQPCAEWLFKKALCLVHLRQHKEAVPDLLQLVTEDPSYSRDVYSTLAMCLLAVGDLSAALKQISKGLSRFPRFSEGYLIRGQLYNKAQKWDKAVADFYKVRELTPTDGNCYIGLSEALVAMGDRRKALKMLNKAISCKNTALEGLVKRAALLFQVQEYSAALTDLDTALAANSGFAEAYYYKALVYFAQNNYPDSALCLEQVIKYDLPPRLFTGPAIYNLGTIRIKQRDFYGALHTFKRAAEFEVPEQKVLQGFVEAILSLMKRDFTEGVEQLTQIIRRKHSMLRDYIGKCFAYRGFGHASLNNHEAAVKDFVTANKHEPIDLATQFNFLMSQGILVARTNAQEAMKIFDKAEQQCPNSAEPAVYKAACLFELSCAQHNLSLAEDALILLDQVVKQRDDESDAYFHRAVVQYTLHRALKAVPDIELAIDKAEDNLPEHFLLKGLCYAQLKMYQEAMQEFSIVLQLDESFTDALYFRGRCAFLLQDTEAAFADYEELLQVRSQDPLSHVRAGDLFLVVGSVDDAMQAYSNALETGQSDLAHMRMAECHLLRGNLKAAIAELTPLTDTYAQFDKTVLDILLGAHNKDDLSASLIAAIAALQRCLKQPAEGRLCKFKHVHWYKGVFLFYLGYFSKARKEFKTALKKYCNTDADGLVDTEDLELVFNVALCSLMNHSYEKALEELHEIIFLVGDKDRGKLLMLLGLIQHVLKRTAQATQLLHEAQIIDPANVCGNQHDTRILPLNCLSRFACTFPMAKTTVGAPLLLRPSFHLPKSPRPVLTFGSEAAGVAWFGVGKVKCRPEAPWLNRVKGSIQFTEEVHDILHEVSFQETEPEDSVVSEDSDDYDLSKDKKCKSAVLLSHREDTNEIVNAYFNRHLNLAEEFPDY